MSRMLLVHPGPEFSVHDVFAGWEKALRQQGHQVLVFNTHHRLSYHGNTQLKAYPEDWDGTRQLPACPACGQEPYKKALTDEQVKTIVTRQIFEDAYALWPDIIFFVSGFFFDEAVLEVLRARGHKLVMLHTESPYEDERQMRIGAHVDLNLINDPTNLEAWRNAGLSAYYMPHAHDPEIHYPGDRRYESDFTFIGTGFRSRRDFFSRMGLWDMKRSGLEISIGGGGWGDAAGEPENAHLLDFLGHHPELCVDNAETAHQYRIARVGLNLYRREGEDGTDYSGWAMGPREVEMAACGMFFARDPRPEGDELFEGILPTFGSPAEARDLIRWYARHDEERELRAARAREKVADRTFGSNAARFTEHMDNAGLTV